MEIEKKVLPEYFEAILQGKKKYELRLNDFDIAEGDTMILKEWDGQKYTGRELRKTAKYVGKFYVDNLFWPEEDIKKHGLQVISFD